MDVSCSAQGKRGKLRWRCWGLLTCCRQVWAEAQPLLWQENVWWFWGMETCHSWVGRVRSAEQAAWLAKLAIVVDASRLMCVEPERQDTNWGVENVRKLKQRLPGLRKLWLMMKVNPGELVPGLEKHWRRHSWIPGVLELGKGKERLIEAHVLINLGDFFRKVKARQGEDRMKLCMTAWHMTESEVIDYANGVEQALLEG